MCWIDLISLHYWLIYNHVNQSVMPNPMYLPNRAWILRITFPLWILWGIVWTVGLLRPEPIRMRDAVVPGALAIFVSKGLHVVGYLILALWPAVRWGPKQLWVVGLCCIGHGFLTETLQPYCGRNGSWMDVGWDALGVLLGLGLAICANRSNGSIGNSGEST